MPQILPFRLGIDHAKKQLRMIVKGASGHDARASMDLSGISELMAILSHCEHALVLSHAGQEVSLPLDPTIAFQSVAGGHAIGAYEGITRFASGTDDAQGLVSVIILGSSARLSGYRMSPDTARALGQALLDAADKTPEPPMKQ